MTTCLVITPKDPYVLIASGQAISLRNARKEEESINLLQTREAKNHDEAECIIWRGKMPTQAKRVYIDFSLMWELVNPRSTHSHALEHHLGNGDMTCQPAFWQNKEYQIVSWIVVS